MRILLLHPVLGPEWVKRAFAGGDKAAKYEVVLARTLGDALLQLRQDGKTDVALVGLQTPDLAGIAGFQRLFAADPDLPCIALDDAENDEQARELVRQGVQDYLVGPTVEKGALRRAICHALDRHALLRQIQAGKDREEQLQRELDEYKQLYTQGVASVVAQSFGVKPLKELMSEKFNALTNGYGAALDLAIAGRIHKEDAVSQNPAEILQRLSDELGFLQAGARDVVDIHTTTIRRKIRDVADNSTSIYLEEGRFLLVELMGYLLAFYRKYALPAVREGRSQNASST